MKIQALKNECTACGACMSVCPKKCIDFITDDEGFYFPSVDNDKCIKCGKCESVCHCLNLKPTDIQKTSYYGFSLDDAVRKDSTSGGAFAALANIVLSDGGNVYGAAFDFENLQLKHTSTDKVSLKELQKSKYIESYMGDIISDIQRDLDKGRRVLFCGAPCQAAGVRQAVIDKHNLLVTVDFICHGVPSSLLFKEHLKHIHKKEQLLDLDFRTKDKGWNSKNIRLVTKTKTKTTPYYLDSFYKGFITENAFLRRSCYNCKFRNAHYSDITIADFWGYRDLDPKLNDEKGLSLIVANNEHGNNFVKELRNFELHKIDNKYSDYAYKPKDYSSGLKLRERFYEEYKKYGFEKAAKKTYMQNYGKQRIKYFIKKILGRV